MPLYEFKCRECDHTWEIRMPYKAPFPECPGCGSADVRKVYHTAALIFKGSGWHVTDYGSNGANGANGASSSSTPSSPSSSDTDTTSASTASSSSSDSSGSDSGSSSSSSSKDT